MAWRRHKLVLLFVLVQLFILILYWLSSRVNWLGVYRYTIVPFVYYYAVPPKALPLADCHVTEQKVNSLLQWKSSGDDVQMPRIIHQSWKTTELPQRFSRWRDSWLRCYPPYKWKHVLWTDEENRCLVQERLPWFLPHYDSLPGPIYRVDAIRYVYLWLFGGVYADLDTECLRPFHNLFTDKMKVIFGAMDAPAATAFAKFKLPHFIPTLSEGLVHNSFMVATEVNNSVWIEMLQRIVRREDFARPESLTGSGALMKVIENRRLEGDICIFPAKFFNPFSWVNNPYPDECKTLNQMSQEDLARCRDRYAITARSQYRFFSSSILSKSFVAFILLYICRLESLCVFECCTFVTFIAYHVMFIYIFLIY